MPVTSLTVDVVLPCRDEAAALPWVLGRLPAGYRAIVVDNGSRDLTADVARGLGARVVTEAVPGYGMAVHTGLVAADADVVAVLDADASLDPAVLPDMVGRLLEGADLVVGRRRPTSPAAWPWHGRMANAYLSASVRRRTGLAVRDIGPVRVARRSALLDLGVRDRRFGYPLELLLRAGAAGWRVEEVDVAYGERAAGTTSKVTGSVRGTARAARDLRRVLA